MSLVAQEFSILTGYEFKKDLIYRIKDTKPQYKLSLKEREKNLKNAFHAEKKNYNKEKILLIDDILTTGSTIKEMVKTLKNSGISDVTVFVTSCTEYNLT
jgi:predicted amidophosphoribosyltransferase